MNFQQVKNRYFSTHSLTSGLIVLIGLLLIINIVGFLILRLLPAKEPPIANIVERYAENDLRVGDQITKLELLDGQELISQSENNGFTIYTYASVKNPNLHLKIIATDLVIQEIQYPLILDEMAYLEEVELPESNFEEFWFDDRVNEKVRIYPAYGLAISYHNGTRSVYDLYQFYPSKYELFLANHPEFIQEQPPEDEVNFTKDMFRTDLENPTETPQP